MNIQMCASSIWTCYWYKLVIVLANRALVNLIFKHFSNYLCFCFRSTAYTPSLADTVRICHPERHTPSLSYILRLRTVIPGAVGADKCGDLSRVLLLPPSEWRASYATPRESAKLCSWQGWDSKPWPFRNNSELKLQPHSSLTWACYATAAL